MVKFTAIASLATMAATVVSQQVDCILNGNVVATVDLDTGLCPYPIDPSLPVKADITNLQDYDVDFYYLLDEGAKYFNDIAAAGRTIFFPANTALNNPNAISGLFHVHDQRVPDQNSTEAIKKRLFKDSYKVKRDDVQDVVNYLKTLDGTPVDTQNTYVVRLANETSSSANNEGTATVTEQSTTIITITSCSEDKCHETTVPATQGPTTTTVNGETTVYTTWCPVETETVVSTTVITVTSCSEDKCHETTVPATQGPTTTTVNGEETVYTTWCPVETETVASTSYVTVTSCNEECHETSIPVTQGPTTATVSGSVVTYTTWCPVVTPSGTPATPATPTTPATNAPGTNTPATPATPATNAPATTAPATTAPVVSTPTTVAAVSTPGAPPASVPTVSVGAAGKVGVSFALIAIPLLNFL